MTTHKFHARATEYQGVKYHSRAEARYAAELDLRQKAGEVLFWLRQVPFQLTASVYRLDFMVFLADGSVDLIEVKGHSTPMGELKIKEVEALYPVKIEIVR